ncbi:MAG TPA: hypothetical protein VJO35_17140 [Terriglobales bacterium]|nr:hypothetical protein [Terriglobales bacterium]
MKKFLLYIFCCTAIASIFVNLQASAAPQSSGKIPVMDGGAGPCSLELTIMGPDSKPVYDATVKVHIAYGFAGTHRLDLQAGTNADGKVRFTGIPARVHRPPIEFQATKDDLQKVLDYDPATECEAKHQLTLEKPKAQAGE